MKSQPGNVNVILDFRGNTALSAMSFMGHASGIGAIASKDGQGNFVISLNAPRTVMKIKSRESVGQIRNAFVLLVGPDTVAM